jgi:hypothetical protein
MDVSQNEVNLILADSPSLDTVSRILAHAKDARNQALDDCYNAWEDRDSRAFDKAEGERTGWGQIIKRAEDILGITFQNWTGD